MSVAERQRFCRTGVQCDPSCTRVCKANIPSPVPACNAPAGGQHRSEAVTVGRAADGTSIPPCCPTAPPCLGLVPPPAAARSDTPRAALLMPTERGAHRYPTTGTATAVVRPRQYTQQSLHQCATTTGPETMPCTTPRSHVALHAFLCCGGFHVARFLALPTAPQQHVMLCCAVRRRSQCTFQGGPEPGTAGRRRPGRPAPQPPSDTHKTALPCHNP